MNEKIISSLKEVQNLIFLENEPMSKHTSFKIGGPARHFIDVRSKDAAEKALMIFHNAGISPFVLGNGSNLLFPDEEFVRPVIKFSFSEISVSDDIITADAGAMLALVSMQAQKNSLAGLEFAQGIPGTVGGAVVMNAGAYGGEISDVLISSTYFSNGKICAITLPEHNFGYRESFYKNNPDCIILSAKFKLPRGKASEIFDKMRDFSSRRREKQPLDLPSAGSAFKRPVGYFAGALIEECGLKGFTIGGAKVSEKHAGFIVNAGGATSDDVKKLILHIQETVLKETGVSLEPEICIL